MTSAPSSSSQAMEVVDVETSLGPVRFWGRFRKFRNESPLAFCINGAFADLDYLWWLDGADADYVFAHLPGFHSPRLVTTSVGAFARAFEQAMRDAFARPFIGFGVSTGALVALAMRGPTRIVAVEPFLSTAGLWSFQEFSPAGRSHTG